MNPTKQQIRQLRRDNAKYPVQLQEISSEDWPPGDGYLRIAVFRSRDFLVQIFDECTVIRMSVNRTDWDENLKRWREDISWDDLQRLKAEAGFGDRDAVEVFPRDEDVVNVANMRHLWIMPGTLSFAWRCVPASMVRKNAPQTA